MSQQKQPIYEFGPFRLDAAEHQLLRGAEPVALTPKAFDTLLVLVEGRGHVFSKEELLAAVWPDSFVEENNLAQNVSLLRKALGDSAGDGQYIETVPKRGYRFVAQVKTTMALERQAPEESAAAPSAGPHMAGAADALIVSRRTRTHVITRDEIEAPTTGDSMSAAALPADAPPHALLPAPTRLTTRRAVLIAAALCLAGGALAVWLVQRARRPASAAEVKTLAVLPFRELAAQAGPAQTEGSGKYLGLGMADALITKFGNVRHVVARPTSAVRRYGDTENPAAAGRELGVDAVLVGNIQRVGERLRVTVQLLRVADGAPLWGETFDDHFTDIFAVQDSISERVVAALTLRLSGEERARLRKRYTENVEAYRLYLMGVNEWNKFTPAGVQQSIDYFNQSIAVDPTYALAYTGLAMAYDLQAHQGDTTPREGAQKSRWAAERAIALDDALAEAHYALAAVKLFDDWDWPAAERGLARAIELNPNAADFHALRASYLEALGRFDEALAELRQAEQLNPLSPFIHMETAQTLYYARRYDEAIAQGRQILALDPHFYLSYYSLGRALEQKGRHEEAIATLQQGVATFGRDPITVGSLGHAYAVAGRRAEAQAALAELQRMAGRRYVPPYWLALIAAGLGDKERALTWLERAADDRYFLLIWLRHEPRFDSLHAEPRFNALLRRIGPSAE